MIITIGTILVALLVLCHVLPKRLFALFANEMHLRRLCQLVVRHFCVTFWAIEPFLTARRANGDLRVENVLAFES